MHEAVLKMFPVITEVPSACVTSAMYCACTSVGKPGYSSVIMSAASSGLSPMTRTDSADCAVLTPTSLSSRAEREVARVAAGDINVSAGQRAR